MASFSYGINIGKKKQGKFSKYLTQNIWIHYFKQQIGQKYNSQQKKSFKRKYVAKWWWQAKNTILLKLPTDFHIN